MLAFFDTRKSPNYSDRHGVIIDTIILHHTACDLDAALNALCNPLEQKSAHSVIARNGDIYSLVDLSKKAWHVGKSQYDYNGDGKIVTDEYGLNARSLGIEIVSMGDTYTNYQMTAVVYLCLQCMHLYSITANHILGHKEVSLIGKIDPGNFNMDIFRNVMQGLYNVRTKVLLDDPV